MVTLKKEREEKKKVVLFYLFAPLFLLIPFSNLAQEYNFVPWLSEALMDLSSFGNKLNTRSPGTLKNCSINTFMGVLY